MKKHKHWVKIGFWLENKEHLLSEKHLDAYSLRKHDIETGKLYKWLKKHNLKLTDAGYDAYMEKVIAPQLKKVIATII